MIRVIGFYRWKDGATFDHDYYNSAHMRLTKQALSPHGLLRLESDRYVSAKSPVAGDIIAASNAYFPSIEVAQSALAAAGAALTADLSNYTNLTPELRLSVVTDHP
ncbi:EthD family reductase [Dyella sp. Tek66A03]|uniref:EthD family reductase n=1 Tax=Dyella sp. Tek66A03 TaxID=3458298 RepID=UPI00403EA0EA